jgi:hypothetical protein
VRSPPRVDRRIAGGALVLAFVDAHHDQCACGMGVPVAALQQPGDSLKVSSPRRPDDEPDRLPVPPRGGPARGLEDATSCSCPATASGRTSAGSTVRRCRDGSAPWCRRLCWSCPHP